MHASAVLHVAENMKLAELYMAMQEATGRPINSFVSPLTGTDVEAWAERARAEGLLVAD